MATTSSTDWRAVELRHIEQLHEATAAMLEALRTTDDQDSQHLAWRARAEINAQIFTWWRRIGAPRWAERLHLNEE